MKFNILVKSLFVTILTTICVTAQEIQKEALSMVLNANTSSFNKTILENEIGGITVTQISITGKQTNNEIQKEGYRDIYLFVNGTGNIKAGKKSFAITPESILVQNAIKKVSFKASKNDTLHFLKISSKLTEQDLLDLKEFPKENTQEIYFKKFTECEAYTEPIKSPNTISRTIFPNKYIPRIAMGTVQAPGPDKVAPHEHGMLEQLFFGLTGNEITVFADKAQTKLPAYTLLHIPLGSMHSVEVDSKKEMYYIWMDFFLDKKGEEWLKTHNAIKQP